MVVDADEGVRRPSAATISVFEHVRLTIRTAILRGPVPPRRHGDRRRKVQNYRVHEVR
jgi:hypothetical protein